MLCTCVQYYNSEIGEVFAVPLNDEHHTLLGRYAALVERPQLLISSYEEAIALSPATKILLMTNDPTTLVREAKNRFVDGDFNVVVGSPHPFFVEFLPPDASKGAGLKAVCEHLQLDIASVVAFGDGDNDKEMLEMAGIGVAMANAKPAAKSAANIVLEVSTLRHCSSITGNKTKHNSLLPTCTLALYNMVYCAFVCMVLWSHSCNF